jgi:hypothetical protein
MPDHAEDPGPIWWQWIERRQPYIAAALVAACWGVSSVLPMGWAT